MQQWQRSRMSDAIMCRSTMTSLDEIINFSLFGTKLMLIFSQMVSNEDISVEFKSKFKHFYSCENVIGKMTAICLGPNLLNTW